MKVSLFVTGAMEHAALAETLGHLFAEHVFECIPQSPLRPPFDGFTSTRLPVVGPSKGVRTVIDIIVQRAAAEVLDRAGHRAPDLLVILDDLELANVDQPNVVVECFRDAVRRHLDGLGHPLRQRTANALRQRASLHFAVPMTESWLFADPKGARKAGMPDGRTPMLSCGLRLEEFLTNDSEYLDDDCSQCKKWQQVQGRDRLTRAKRRANEPEWCRGRSFQRNRHPKRYLAWLCRDPQEKKCSHYREVGRDRERPSGATALRELDWSALTSNSVQMPFLNAMIRDLADGLGEPDPLGEDVETARQTRRKSRNGGGDWVLRNL